MSKDSADAISPSSSASSAASLDSLLSPKASTFEPVGATNGIRESVAESEFSDVGLGGDESPLSSVALSARSSMKSFKSAVSTGSRRHSTSSAGTHQESVARASGGSSHKKSASTTTIRSIRNVPFLLARLDAQKAEGASRSDRGSMDGRFHEEFAKLQVDQEKADGTVIDWGMYYFWGAVISDYQDFAAKQPEQLARAIEKGIPGTLRGMMWQLMAASKDPELENTYLKLLKETSTHEKAIIRDLGRTFPHHEFFHDGQGIGQENLFNVLKAYSLYDPQVGYCQGLPFVVAILLLNMPDEEAFSLLVRLMYSYQLRGHFLPEMPGLQLRLFQLMCFTQFDRLIEELLPVLHLHFLRQGIKSSMFCSQWFLTLFSYRFPQEIVFRIYDSCLANGIEAIFGFSIILLAKNEEALLSLKFDELLAFLNTRLFDVYKVRIDPTSEETEGSAALYKVDEFIQDAFALRITPFMLDSYRHEYEEVVRRTNAHAIEIDNLRNSNRLLSAQVKSLESSLAQINTEHVELLNQLVMARLRNEEMEGELVRYKLLYAEAMHENQDAQSSHRISLASMLSMNKSNNR
ncbi:GTPase-activating protein [Pleurotus ostreatus]|uniref:GTPase-activating protein n=1 Tax=Pleurotus ostreatus TaxID=5322 RepID=A0A8H7DS40_PLEOS|nr:GTPase-activating protein [Pleurotus ostreatus]KAF7428674.1 GTPase-activating protein [Pleurotus ostreatus]